LARLKPAKRLPATAVQPPVTLLIAAYNEADNIAQKLDNSLDLDYPADRLQILVTADGSDDQTPDIVRQYADRGVVL
jgi:cellulose synthase/poly-beta-1,6-N-acetylglucosamine synthase-like glycosyltransferase